MLLSRKRIIDSYDFITERKVRLPSSVPSGVLFITFTYMGKCNLSEFQVEILNILFAIDLYCN